jgi:hypothetical protein
MVLNIKYGIFPPYLVVLNFLFIMLLPVAALCFAIDYFNIKKIFPKVFLRVGGLVEWFMFMVCICWNIFMSIFLLSI